MRKWIAGIIVALALTTATLAPSVALAWEPKTDFYTVCRINYIWLWDGVTVIVIPIVVCSN